MSERDPLFGAHASDELSHDKAWWSSWRVMGIVGALAIVALVLAALTARPALTAARRRHRLRSRSR